MDNNKIPEKKPRREAANYNGTNDEGAGNMTIVKTSSAVDDSIAQMIVNLGFPETFGESIDKLATGVKNMNAAISLQGINTFTITVDKFRRTITTLSENVRGQLIQRILQSPYFTLHFVEYLDMKNFATLIATVRYIHETNIKNELLFSKRLGGMADNESCVIITNFLRDYNFNWENCVGISMDNIRWNCEIPNRFLEVIFNQGFSRHADFIAQQLPDVLAETLRDAIAILNILKRDISLKFDYEMDNEYQQTLYHTDQYWLSHCRLLSRLFEMRDKCKDMPELLNFKDKLNDINWLYKLAYLADIFEEFRRFNRDLQAKQFKFRTYDKIAGMILKLQMYETNVANRDFKNFPTLRWLLRTNEVQQNIHPDVLGAMTTNLQRLHVGMNRFSQPAEEIEDYTWIRNPFDVYPDEMTLSMDEKGMLFKLKIDCFMKRMFNEGKLDYFWSYADRNYPDLATKAIKYLLIFTNSQLSELAFASLVNIRANSLTDLEHEESYLLIKLSKSLQGLNDNLTDN